ncbi:MAG: hypothetical protein RR959_07175 [Erysipelotrichaceae bacterium]
MNQKYWDNLKSYINRNMEATKEGASICDTISVKNQMLTRVHTFQAVLDVMNTYEEYKEYDDNEIHNETK